jgi:cytochrome d ubiquinol oxidase subunit II
VSYEFQNKLGNFLGPKTFQWFLIINGLVGPLLLGGAVATFFEGSNFIIEKGNLVTSQLPPLDSQLSTLTSQLDLTPVISRWANGSHGLDALLNPWVLIFGLAVMFLARVLGILYIINNVRDKDIRARGSKQLIYAAAPFLILFLTYLLHLLLKDGYAYDEAGYIYMEPYKYLHNFLALCPLALLFLFGVVLVLWGIITEYLRGRGFFTLRSSLFAFKGIWYAGIGTVLTVLCLLLCAGWNHTAYYPSTADLQSSLTIQNSCSSEFTLNTMFYVSLLIPFVMAYIIYAWRAIDKKKLDKSELYEDHSY